MPAYLLYYSSFLNGKGQNFIFSLLFFRLSNMYQFSYLHFDDLFLPVLFQTPVMQLGATPSAAAAVIRATTSSVGSGSTSGGSGINAPPTNVPASLPPVGSRPTNDPLSQISSKLTSSTSLVSSVAAAAASVAAARRSVSPPSSIPLGLDRSTSSAPHSPSPVGSLISKDIVNSQPSGGVPSPTYSQVRSFVKIWQRFRINHDFAF